MLKQTLARLVLPTLSAAFVALAVATPAAWAAPAHRGTMAPTSAPAHERAAAAPFLVHGKTLNLQSFKGQPVMLWQVATWCKSCAVGLKTLAQNRALIDASNVKVIVLRDYKDGGYPGVSMEKFTAENAPALLHDPHFTIGEDTQELDKRYDPHHYVDIYYLIKPNGRVAMTASNPAMSFNKIKQFIKQEGKS